MSAVSSQPVEATPRPPFYGPDHRYLPPPEIGVALPLHLPSHLELPEENGEIVEQFDTTAAIPAPSDPAPTFTWHQTLKLACSPSA
jgi:hypothetical protein